MNKLFDWLFPGKQEKHDEIESLKSDILKEKKDTLDSLKKLNKKFRFTIESGQIEFTIKNITEITKGK